MQTIWEQIAMENQVTPEEVVRDVQAAIQAGMANEDPKVQRQWKKLVGDREEPNPEEVLAGIVALVLEEMALSFDEVPEETWILPA